MKEEHDKAVVNEVVEKTVVVDNGKVIEKGTTVVHSGSDVGSGVHAGLGAGASTGAGLGAGASGHATTGANAGANTGAGLAG